MTNIKNVVQYGITWGYGQNIKSVVSTLKCWTKGPPQLISSVRFSFFLKPGRGWVGRFKILKKNNFTGLNFNFVKPCLVMQQFDWTISPMVWEEVLSWRTCHPYLLLDSRRIWKFLIDLYQMGWNIDQKCLWKFNPDQTTETMSRLHLSSKSPPGF